MFTAALVLGSILVVFASYTVLAPLVMNYGRFAGFFRLPCPERHTDARVEVNAAGAAISSAYGGRNLHVAHCSLLDRGAVCDGACLKGMEM